MQTDYYKYIEIDIVSKVWKTKNLAIHFPALTCCKTRHAQLPHNRHPILQLNILKSIPLLQTEIKIHRKSCSCSSDTFIKSSEIGFMFGDDADADNMKCDICFLLIKFQIKRWGFYPQFLSCLLNIGNMCYTVIIKIIVYHLS